MSQEQHGNGLHLDPVPIGPTFMERLETWLCDHQPAIAFMRDVLLIAARWDDLIDRDQKLLDEDIHQVLETCLSLPCHAFFMQQFHELYPLLRNAVRNWKVANAIERDPESGVNALMNAFILRASYIDLI